VQISTPGGGGWGSLDADAAHDDQADIS